MPPFANRPKQIERIINKAPGAKKDRPLQEQIKEGLEQIKQMPMGELLEISHKAKSTARTSGPTQYIAKIPGMGRRADLRVLWEEANGGEIRIVGIYKHDQLK